VPVCIEFILQAGLSYADLIMVGTLGKNATAAVGLTQEINYLLRGVLMALAIGIVAYVSVAAGRKDFKKVKRATVQAFYLAGSAGAILLAITLVISPYLPGWLGADPEIAPTASMYFRIIFLPVIFTSLSMLLSSVLRGAGDMKTPMFVNIFMSVSNVLFNFLFIYDSRIISIAGIRLSIWGAGLGVRGSAIGTALATGIGGVLMIFGVLKNKLVSPYKEKLTADLVVIKEIIKVAIPVFFLRISTSLGRVIFMSFVARLGTVVFASHTIAATAESIFYMAVVGMQASVTTLAGNCKGEGDAQKLSQLTKISTRLIAAVMLGTGVLMIVFARPVVSLFTKDQAVIQIAVVLFTIVAVNEPFFGVSFVMEGIFNGTGDTKSPLLVQFFSLWFVRVLGTWLCVYVLGFGVYGAWVCMIAENITRAIALCIRYQFVKKHLIAPKDLTSG
jgi:putative MATE family efflux protein